MNMRRKKVLKPKPSDSNRRRNTMGAWLQEREEEEGGSDGNLVMIWPDEPRRAREAPILSRHY